MATSDVPGADPTNRDKLARGCWANHEDGSIIFVMDIDENGRVVFNMYDFKDADHPVYYSHAMPLKDFEKTFSYDPRKVETLNLKWTWHDKTPMPWDKVMRLVDRPIPTPANIDDHLSAAARMAKSLQARVKASLNREHVEAVQGFESRPATSLKDRIKNALSALVD